MHLAHQYSASWTGKRIRNIPIKVDVHDWLLGGMEDPASTGVSIAITSSFIPLMSALTCSELAGERHAEAFRDGEEKE